MSNDSRQRAYKARGGGRRSARNTQATTTRTTTATSIIQPVATLVQVSSTNITQPQSVLTLPTSTQQQQTAHQHNLPSPQQQTTQLPSTQQTSHQRLKLSSSQQQATQLSSIQQQATHLPSTQQQATQLPSTQQTAHQRLKLPSTPQQHQQSVLTLPSTHHGIMLPSTQSIQPSTQSIQPSTQPNLTQAILTLPSTQSIQPPTQSIQPSTQSLQLIQASQPTTQSAQLSTQSLQLLQTSTQSIHPSTQSIQPSTQSLQPLQPTIQLLQPTTQSIQPSTQPNLTQAIITIPSTQSLHTGTSIQSLLTLPSPLPGITQRVRRQARGTGTFHNTQSTLNTHTHTIQNTGTQIQTQNTHTQATQNTHTSQNTGAHTLIQSTQNTHTPNTHAHTVQNTSTHIQTPNTHTHIIQNTGTDIHTQLTQNTGTHTHIQSTQSPNTHSHTIQSTGTHIQSTQNTQTPNTHAHTAQNTGTHIHKTARHEHTHTHTLGDFIQNTTRPVTQSLVYSHPQVLTQSQVHTEIQSHTGQIQSHIHSPQLIQTHINTQKTLLTNTHSQNLNANTQNQRHLNTDTQNLSTNTHTLSTNIQNQAHINTNTQNLNANMNTNTQNQAHIVTNTQNQAQMNTNTQNPAQLNTNTQNLNVNTQNQTHIVTNTQNEAHIGSNLNANNLLHLECSNSGHTVLSELSQVGLQSELGTGSVTEAASGINSLPHIINSTQIERCSSQHNSKTSGNMDIVSVSHSQLQDMAQHPSSSNISHLPTTTSHTQLLHTLAFPLPDQIIQHSPSPLTHSQSPLSHSLTYTLTQPLTHTLTQSPLTHTLTQSPLTHTLTQSPLTQSPLTHTLVQSPFTHTQSPLTQSQILDVLGVERVLMSARNSLNQSIQESSVELEELSVLPLSEGFSGQPEQNPTTVQAPTVSQTQSQIPQVSSSLIPQVSASLSSALGLGDSLIKSLSLKTSSPPVTTTTSSLIASNRMLNKLLDTTKPHIPSQVTRAAEIAHLIPSVRPAVPPRLEREDSLDPVFTMALRTPITLTRSSPPTHTTATTTLRTTPSIMTEPVKRGSAVPNDGIFDLPTNFAVNNSTVVLPSGSHGSQIISQREGDIIYSGSLPTMTEQQLERLSTEVLKVLPANMKVCPTITSTSTNNTGISSTGNTGISNISSTGNTGIGSTGNAGISSTGNTGMSNISSTGNTGIGSTGNAGIGSTGNAGIGSTGISVEKTSKKTSNTSNPKSFSALIVPDGMNKTGLLLDSLKFQNSNMKSSMINLTDPMFQSVMMTSGCSSPTSLGTPVITKPGICQEGLGRIKTASDSRITHQTLADLLNRTGSDGMPLLGLSESRLSHTADVLLSELHRSDESDLSLGASLSAASGEELHNNGGSLTAAEASLVTGIGDSAPLQDLPSPPLPSFSLPNITGDFMVSGVTGSKACPSTQPHLPTLLSNLATTADLDQFLESSNMCIDMSNLSESEVSLCSYATEKPSASKKNTSNTPASDLTFTSALKAATNKCDNDDMKLMHIESPKLPDAVQSQFSEPSKLLLDDEPKDNIVQNLSDSSGSQSLISHTSQERPSSSTKQSQAQTKGQGQSEKRKEMFKKNELLVQQVACFKCRLCSFLSQDKGEMVSHMKERHSQYLSDTDESEDEPPPVSTSKRVKVLVPRGETAEVKAPETKRVTRARDGAAKKKKTQETSAHSDTNPCIKKEEVEPSGRIGIYIKSEPTDVGLFEGRLVNRSADDELRIRVPVENKSAEIDNEVMDDDTNDSTNIADTASNNLKPPQKQAKAPKSSTPKKKSVKSEDSSLGIRCDINGCGLRLKSESNITYHRKCHVKNMLQCPECLATKFQSWRDLALHLWRQHLIDMELHKCDKCDYKSYSYSKLMNVHHKIHSDERPSLCDTCGKRFKTPKQLRNHKVLHMKKNEVPQLQCEICQRPFSDKRMLRNHQESVHKKVKPFLCNYCGYSTASRSTLKMHMRQHTGEKPFACEKCDYRTSDHNSLRRHKMQHSGVRPYRCPYCDYASIQSTTFKVHLKDKHPGLAQLDGIMFTCGVCSFKTVKRDNYLAHVAEHSRADAKRMRQAAYSVLPVRKQQTKPESPEPDAILSDLTPPTAPHVVNIDVNSGTFTVESPNHQDFLNTVTVQTPVPGQIIMADQYIYAVDSSVLTQMRSGDNMVELGDDVVSVPISSIPLQTSSTTSSLHPLVYHVTTSTQSGQ